MIIIKLIFILMSLVNQFRSYLSKFIRTKLLERFIQIEIITGIVGGLSSAIMFVFFSFRLTVHSFSVHGYSVQGYSVHCLFFIIPCHTIA